VLEGLKLAIAAVGRDEIGRFFERWIVHKAIDL
jgi:hypothetical protein